MTVDGMDEWMNFPLAFLWDHITSLSSLFIFHTCINYDAGILGDLEWLVFLFYLDRIYYIFVGENR